MTATVVIPSFEPTCYQQIWVVSVDENNFRMFLELIIENSSKYRKDWRYNVFFWTARIDVKNAISTKPWPREKHPLYSRGPSLEFRDIFFKDLAIFSPFQRTGYYKIFLRGRTRIRPGKIFYDQNCDAIGKTLRENER